MRFEMKRIDVEGPTTRYAAWATPILFRWLLGPLVLALTTVSASAGVEGVRVQVDGLACPFCAYNIEKRFKTLDGVDHKADFEVNTDAGYARFAWTPTVAFDPAAVDEQIRRAGFTPAGIELTAEGSVSWVFPQEQAPGGLLLNSSSAEQSVWLISHERADRAASFDALQAIVQRSEQEQAGVEVRIHGEVEPTEDGAWRLALYRWEPLVYGALIELEVEGMTCEGCSLGLMKALSGEDDVIHVEADYVAGRVQVWTGVNTPNSDAFRHKIEEAGFKVTGSRVAESHQEIGND
jgi:copper chaperone CopZ